MIYDSLESEGANIRTLLSRKLSCPQGKSQAMSELKGLGGKGAPFDIKSGARKPDLELGLLTDYPKTVRGLS